MADKKEQAKAKIELKPTHKSMLAGAGGALIAILIVLSSVGAVRAMSGRGNGDRPAGGPPMMMQAEGRGGEMRGGPRLGGEITKIEGSTITVTGRDDQTITVKVDDNTNYKKDGDDAKISDLKVGDNIMIRGEVQSVTVNADSIGIRQ